MLINIIRRVCVYVFRGTLDDKIHFIFNMYDVSHDKSVSKQELATLLNQVPKDKLTQSTLYLLSSPIRIPTTHTIYTLTSPVLFCIGLIPGFGLASDSVHEDITPIPEGEEGGPDGQGDHDEGAEYNEVDHYTNHDMVEKAFDECDLNHEGRLTYEEFKMWIQRNPSLVQYIESILPYNGPKDLHRHANKVETLPHMKRVSSIAKMNGGGYSHSQSNLQDAAGEVFNHNSGFHRRNTITSSQSNRGNRASSFMSTQSNGGGVGGGGNIVFQDNASGANMSLHRDNSSSSSLTNEFPRTGSFNESHYDNEEAVRHHLIQVGNIMYMYIYLVYTYT